MVLFALLGWLLGLFGFIQCQFVIPDAITIQEGLIEILTINKTTHNDTPLYLSISSNSTDVLVLNKTILFPQSMEKSVQVRLQSQNTNKDYVKLTITTNSTLPAFVNYLKTVQVIQKASCGVFNIVSCISGSIYLTATLKKLNLNAKGLITVKTTNENYYISAQSFLPDCPLTSTDTAPEFRVTDEPRLYGDGVVGVFYEIKSKQLDCGETNVVLFTDENFNCVTPLSATTSCTVSDIRPWKISVIFFSIFHCAVILAFILLVRRKNKQK